MTPPPPSPDNEFAPFIKRWQASSGAERANKDLFLSELCDVLRVPRPDPVSGVPENDRYVFEKDAPNPREEGSATTGKIDLYKEDCFILEAKQGSDAGTEKVGTAKRSSSTWWKSMQKAYVQAYQYAQSFDAPPPFLIVCDIGFCFDLFATFDGSWNYRHFPDAKRHRIFLADLPTHAATLRAIFTDPHRLDPSRNAAKVTREIAAHLAELARGLEAAGHSGERIATFLMRCIFTMFAEDVGLLPEGIFVKALETEWIKEPKRFVPEVTALWQTMNTGGAIFRVGKILQFNGGLFRDPEALPLSRRQIEQLLDAAKTDWVDVEPAIFGTLLERALDPKERHALGAHFTPRAYVERLVRATIEEPLRAEWDVARTEAYHLLEAGKEAAARDAIRAFHQHLCQVRVLDPACGTGNFLYVTLDLMKRLESEVLGLLADLGDAQVPLEIQGLTVTPAQFHGLEIKPWAKEIAELVLWIGYLQWQLRAKGDSGVIQEPVLQEYENIECRDAVLAYDRVEPVIGADGKPVTRWDGETTKPSPVTGEPIPDDTARVPQLKYVNPRKATWPEADFVVGNPPFIGNKRMRAALGDGYVEVLRKAHDDVPETADFVMYWWNTAAERVRKGVTQRFGLITTNSITQTFNRRVVRRHLHAAPPLHIAIALPDHPWVESSDGAAVRVAMTVAANGPGAGALWTVTREVERAEGAVGVEVQSQSGIIQSDLRVGADVASTKALKANAGLAFQGMALCGEGFVVSGEEADGLRKTCASVVRRYRNGQDLTQQSRNISVVDFFGLSEEDAQNRFPAAFQVILDRVKPERDLQRREARRRRFWLFGEVVPGFRGGAVGLSRFIATCRTAKHRTFSFLDGDILPDAKIIAICLDDGFSFGVLGSRPHLSWALATGAFLEDRPNYNHSTCFGTFPFPACPDPQKHRIRDLGEAIDAHRKRQQALHPTLTITGMYNVLEKLRSGEVLTTKEMDINKQGLVSVLKRIHDDLDAAVFEAYGWPVTLTDEEILERLVALNAERAEEERRGLVRWLRPEFQNPGGAKIATQESLEGAGSDAGDEEPAAGKPAATLPWPKALPEKIAAVRDLLQQGRGQSLESIRASFDGAKPKELRGILDSLAALGLAVAHGESGETAWSGGGRPAGAGGTV